MSTQDPVRISVYKPYINGEFVGGSDIMREMYESGELQQMLGNKA